MNPYSIINEFIRCYHLDKQNPNILGIVFYGSSKYQTNKPSSDIDLLIVTNSSKCYKGVTYIDGVKIEYFEKNFDYLLGQIYDMKNSLDCSLLSIFKNGEILFSKDYSIEYLADESLSQNGFLYKNPAVSHAILNEWLDFIDEISIDNLMFPYIYHNLLEFVRKIFHEENGFSKLSIMKVYELYQNKNYANDFYCVKLPPEDFRNLFLNLMVNDYQPAKFQTLLELIFPKEEHYHSSFKFFHQNELKYKSTIVENCVSKAVTFIKENHPASLHYYYIALEKIRNLYCNINGINNAISLFGYSYDDKFLLLFEECIHKKDANSLIALFTFVSTPLQLDYHNYKVLEYHEKTYIQF